MDVRDTIVPDHLHPLSSVLEGRGDDIENRIDRDRSHQVRKLLFGPANSSAVVPIVLQIAARDGGIAHEGERVVVRLD